MAIQKWSETAPKNDSAILPRAGRSTGRHASIGDQLQALLAWRNRPDGIAEDVPAEPASPIKTNWRTIPANDNRRPADGVGTERALEITPSLGEIERSLEHVDMIEQRRNGKTEYVATGGDIDRATKEGGPIVRIGKLHFSDGTQMERCHILVEDGKVIEGEVVLPVGAMLNTRVKSSRDKGSARDPSETAVSNRYFAKTLGARRVKPPRLLAKRLTGARTSKAQDRAALAAAYDATPALPKIRRYPKGLPAFPTNIADLFLGMKRGLSPDNSAISWEGAATAMEDRNAWAAVVAALSDEHFETLTATASATTLRQLGEARGYSGRDATAAGRRLLVAANDNLADAMKLAEQH
ncbi:hypothetical protein VQ042_01240 [Aurantimonas sp. A2-1-M11]|uniref:hypothetical protein n=1 Tax=Aurantimonas sp. A2-1-M11 TaxID=3113712 RepID=UPI002F92E897